MSDAERGRLDELRKGVFAHAMSWSEEDGTAVYVGGAANRVVSRSELMAEASAEALETY